jgi:hypothetical protein
VKTTDSYQPSAISFQRTPRTPAWPLSFRLHMGLRPTQRNESQDVTPAKAGVHAPEELDSRFRGNDQRGSDFQESAARILALLRNEPQNEEPDRDSSSSADGSE